MDVHARPLWWLLFGLLSLVIGSWSLASPLFSYPDEADHVIKAEAVVRGQLLGHDVGFKVGTETFPYYDVRVPALLKGVDERSFCFNYDAARPASCAPPLGGSTQLVPVRTYVGTYPPLYYLLVGLPSLASPGSGGIHGMRLLSGAVSAGFLASAVMSALAGRRRFVVLGIALAATPVTMYMAGAVNPAGLEITSAICLWVSALTLMGEGSGPVHSRLVARTGLAATVLVSMRGLSPLWLAAIALSLLGVADFDRLRGLLRRRDVRIWSVIVGLSSVVAVAWVIGAGANKVLGIAAPPSVSNAYLMTHAIGQSWIWARGMIGVLGYLNVNAPLFTFVVWLALLAVVLAMALVVAHRRGAVTLAGLVVATFAIPVIVTFANDRSVGPVWQGRYTLPLAAGIPLLASWLVAGSRLRLSRITLHAARLGLVMLGVAEILAFLVATRRFMVGNTGPLYFLHGPWQPPVPAALLVALFIGGQLALTAVYCVLIRPPPGETAEALGPPLTTAADTITSGA